MNKKIIAIIVSVVVVIIAIGSGIFYWQSSHNKVEQIEKKVIVEDEEIAIKKGEDKKEINTVNEESNEEKDVKEVEEFKKEWETYKNEELGFEMEYLKNLKLIERGKEVYFARDCSERMKESFESGHKCDVEGDFKISLYAGTINDFIEGYKDDCLDGECYTKIFLQEEYVLDNNKATRLEGNSMEGSGVYNYVFINKNDKNYLISYNHNVYEYEKMIKSFKFIKE